MQDWSKKDKETIWADKSAGGLLVSFFNDYKEAFELQTLNVSCGSCFNTYYETLINRFYPMEAKKPNSQWKLHYKYNGIQLGHAGRPMRNGEMTDEQAEELYRKHPRGALLFELIPDHILNPKESVESVETPETAEEATKEAKPKRTRTKKE